MASRFSGIWDWHDDLASCWGVARVVDVLAAFALTFGIGHYGLVAVCGTLPWLLFRDRSRSYPWGWFALAALALAAAIAVGLPELGDADHALWAAAVEALIWVHASGWARCFWGGLALLWLLWASVGLVATSVSAGLDLAEAIAAWWGSWQWVVLAALGCGGIWVLTFRDEDTAGGGDKPAVFGPQLGRLEMASVQRRVAAGLAGEERVRALFLERLPKGMWVLNNLRLPGLRGDVDLVVIGANGLFLPEVKTWSGRITCEADGQTWSRVRAGCWELLPNPVAQTQGEIAALRRYLEAADPELCRRTQLWIEGLVVFAHPSATLDVHNSPLPALAPHEAAEAIRTAVPRRPLSLGDQEQIVGLLAAAQSDGRLANYSPGLRNLGGSRLLN